MFRYLIIVTLSVMTGCVSLGGYVKTSVPKLPDSGSLPCCWQVLEKLDIEFQGEHVTLSAVTVTNDNQLTVVLLDALGRRVFAIIQQGNHVRVEQSSLIKNDFPFYWLLIGVYLRHMPEHGWSFEHLNWTFKRDREQVQLLQDNRTKVRLIESLVSNDITSDTSAQNPTALLQYPDLNLNIKITTLLKQVL